MGDTGGCQRRSQVIEGMREGLWERKLHGKVGPNKFLVLEEVVAAIGSTAQDLSPYVETMFP